MIVTNGKIYDYCSDCGRLVRLNKPILGSLHICLTEEEKRYKRSVEAQKQAPYWHKSDIQGG